MTVSLSKSMTRTLLSELFKNRTSSFLLANGPKETGKTDFILWLMKQSYELGYFKYFGLNQEIENAPFEYDFISDLQSLKERCKLLGKRYFYFLDELGKSAPKDVPWKKLNLELIQDMEIIRKYRLTLAGCSIGDVDRRIVNPRHLDYFIEKETLTRAKIYNFRKRYIATITDIPKTSIKFYEYRVAYFTLTPQSNTLIDHPIMVRFKRYKDGEKQGDIWESRQQKKREILKLYDLVRNNVSHID